MNLTVHNVYFCFSEVGCTIALRDGTPCKEVPAHTPTLFVAQQPDMVCSDPAAVVKEIPNGLQLLHGQMMKEQAAGGLPAGYKRVKYLEAPGEHRKHPYIMLGREFNKDTKYEIVATAENLGKSCELFGAWDLNNRIAHVRAVFGTTPSTVMQVGNSRFEALEYKFDDKVTFVLDMPTRNVKINDREATISEANVDGAIDGLVGIPYAIFAVNYPRDSVLGGNGSRIFSYKETHGGKMLVNLVPCLDETGAPCMYDTVGKKAYYNQGGYDFTYPTETTTYSLRRVLPDWGKLTERGLRRLYHVPSSYKGELYDYALENGYKPIIEPEQPEEGYWAPRWTETENEIMLEWVETEPPMEDLTNN